MQRLFLSATALLLVGGIHTQVLETMKSEASMPQTSLSFSKAVVNNERTVHGIQATKIKIEEAYL